MMHDNRGHSAYVYQVKDGRWYTSITKGIYKSKEEAEEVLRRKGFK
jgi:hypothetical protein